jgi:methionyl-tRNA formyltransferase
MTQYRIVFLGTPDFAAESLKSLLADRRFHIVAVVTQPDRPAGRKMQLKASPVKELALSAGLKVFTPETVNTQEFRDQIAALTPESAAVVAFGQILGQKFLDLFPHGCVNVHGSVLPRWRGAAPIQRSIMAGDSEGGVSLQIIVKQLDAGPVLGARRLPGLDQFNAAEAYEKLKVLGTELLHVEYADYLRGSLTPVAQDESLVTIAAKIAKTEARIAWTQSSRHVHNLVRGLAMGPLAFTTRAGQALKILRTGIADEASTLGSPGEVVAVASDLSHFQVACGSGVLKVFEVQPESRARMTVTDYLRGYPLHKGEVLA